MSKNTDTTTFPLTKSEEEWKAALDPTRYSILRQAATERPWTGALLDEKRSGVYTCAACNAELFESGTKFESGSGWPSFYQALNPDAVVLKTDKAFGMTRTEVLCANCGSHLGHLFDDAYQTPTGDRYCMNSLSLNFEQSTDSNEEK
ncbi:peptide-methionine (R)-S-oxide reductase MsrB [soil metagenome]